jgi:hypothetical protein
MGLSRAARSTSRTSAGSQWRLYRRCGLRPKHRADDAASESAGRAGASGASCTFLSMRVCRRSVATQARLLARSGAATGASGTSQRGLRPHCGAADSVPNPASLAGDDAAPARYTPQRMRASNEASKWPPGADRPGSASFSLRTARPSCGPSLHPHCVAPPQLRKSCCKKRPEL